MASNGDNNGRLVRPELLLCPVCKRPFDTPKLLPCLHSFCEPCLQKSLEKGRIAPGDAFLCPICEHNCRVPLRGVPGFKTNIFFVTLQEFQDRKEVDSRQTCDQCDTGSWAERKCIECDDWLCRPCCQGHLRMRMTRDHHLLTAPELRSGQYDEIIKDCFEPLACGRHGEPLKLYCCDPTCSAPICTVCKSTDHVTHRAVALEEQADTEHRAVEALLTRLRGGLQAATDTCRNLKHEERITSSVRKKAHEEINARLEEVVEAVVKAVGDYAQSLHEDVDSMARDHKKLLAEKMHQSKAQVQRMSSALIFAESLLRFGKAEETVSMSPAVCERLKQLHADAETAAPAWRHPTLHPPRDVSTDELSELFGHITFSGEVIKSVQVRAFSAHLAADDKQANVTDIVINDHNDIVLVDKENRKVKIFDSLGRLKLDSGDSMFKIPNRLSTLRASGNILVKDDKAVRVMRPSGEYVSTFASNLRQPVGMRENRNGEILITDWMTGLIHRFNSRGQQIGSFPSMSEAPGYIACDNAGNIFVSDWKENMVKKFSAEGALLAQFGERGSAEGQLDHPYGLCTDSHGHVIVCDTWNHRVQLWSAEGRFLQTLVTKADGLEFPQAAAIDHKQLLVVVELHGSVKLFQYVA